MILRRIVWPLLCCVALVQTAGADRRRGPQSGENSYRTVNPYFLRGQYGLRTEEANIAIKAKRDHAAAYNVLALINAELRKTTKPTYIFRNGLDYQPADRSESQLRLVFVRAWPGQGFAEILPAPRCTILCTRRRKGTGQCRCARCAVVTLMVR